jgi:hypothetical protein
MEAVRRAVLHARLPGRTGLSVQHVAPPLQCMAFGRCLNDHVIGLYLQLLQVRGRRHARASRMEALSPPPPPRACPGAQHGNAQGPNVGSAELRVSVAILLQEALQ